MKEKYQKLVSQFFPFPLKEEELRDLIKKITIKKIPARTILLSEGDIVTKVFLVVRGCLRTYFIKDNGSEITSQFFTEGQMVMSFQSAVTGNPSRLYIDAIEDSVIGFASIKTFEKLISHNNAARDHFALYLVQRLVYYMNQEASFILDSPEKRYVKFIHDSPELVSRIPQQYIASYLGITPVSLSRIRSRIKKINKS